MELTDKKANYVGKHFTQNEHYRACLAAGRLFYLNPNGVNREYNWDRYKYHAKHMKPADIMEILTIIMGRVQSKPFTQKKKV